MGRDAAALVPIEMNRDPIMSNMTDNLIMLLSTDWFLPYWGEIGISIDEVKKRGIQQGCREIVKYILSGSKDYYLRNISLKRKRKSVFRFRALLRKWEAEPEVSETYEEWANLFLGKLNASFTYWCSTIELVQDRVQEGGPNLNASIRAEVVKAWETSHMEVPGFPDICLKSESSWDAYTRTLLVSPKSLGTILNSVLGEHSFKSFWTNLRQRLTPEQVQELLAWYRAMTVNKFHEDRPDLVPSYME